MDSAPFINYINIFLGTSLPSSRLLALLFFSIKTEQVQNFRKVMVRKTADIQGENMEKKKEKIWTLVACSARPTISLLVYPSLLVVLLFSNHILAFLASTFVLLSSFEWNLVKGKHMLGRQMSGRGEGQRRKKKAEKGGDGEREMVGDWKERSNPPWREKEGNSEGLKGREREECWDSEEEKWLWKGKTAIWWAINGSKYPSCMKCWVTF